jgi:hypothetical protein
VDNTLGQLLTYLYATLQKNAQVEAENTAHKHVV